jgi:hypothetical protein
MQDVASLAGAAHGAVVTVSPGKGASSLTVRVKHPDYVSKRTIYRDENGNLVLHNDEFFMKPGSTGKGLGAEVFGRQVEHAQRLGVSHIETLAGGPPAMNGYYTWPRFGYDQHLDSLALMSGRYGDQKIRAAREKFPGVESVSDIFLHHGGAEWWKTNGLAMPEATFDLKSGSRSLKVWHTYLAEKASRSGSPGLVGHSLADDVALMVNVNPRYDPLDHEIDDIGNGEENYDFSPEVESALDASWEKLREEIGGKSPVAHFDPSYLSAEEISVLINSGELDVNTICRDSIGRFASCGAGGRTPSEHDVISTDRMVHARHLVEQVRGRDTPNPADVKALADHLSTLTVAQLHSLKKEYGLKASGKNKAALKEKLTARFNQKSTTAPATPIATPSAPKATDATPAPSSTPPGPVHVPVGTFGTTKDIKWGHPDDEAYAHEVAQKVLGPNATAHDLVSVAGIPDGARVDVTSLMGTHKQAFIRASGTIQTRNPDTGEVEHSKYTADRTIALHPDGTRSIINNSFEGKGSGLQMFGRQVENATKWGFTHIDTYAAGQGSGTTGKRPPEGEYNGYYTWPRFGYNGKVHPDDVERMPPDVQRNARAADNMISGVMSTKEGRDWWMGHGESKNLKFDLTPGSYSQDTLNTYLRHRRVLK